MGLIEEKSLGVSEGRDGVREGVCEAVNCLRLKASKSCVVKESWKRSEPRSGDRVRRVSAGG